MRRQRVGVVVVGSVNMDLVIQVGRMPRAGETLIGSNFTRACGGKGANQAVATARLGAKTTFIGRVGDDDFGRALKANLKKDGVSTRYLLTDDEAPTGVALIIVDKSGENSIVVASGANARVSPDDLSAAKGAWRGARFLIVQFEVPLETVEAALDTARRHEVTSILDAGPAKKCPARILRKADIVSPNEVESETLTGLRIRGIRSAERVASKFRKMGVRTIVLKLGALGALVADGDKCVHIPTPKIKAVDSTAAGDAFTGALAVFLGEGKDLIEATRYACCAGALACLKVGAQPSLPHRCELEKFIRNGNLPPL